jgi:tRNA (cytidine/uridine-2'-O-)-methyltransferase
VNLHRHADFDAFLAARQARGGRLLAFSSQTQRSYTNFEFVPQDWLLFGRESDGLPEAVLERCDERLTIPMPVDRQRQGGGVRSLNLSVAVGVAVFEALRQGTLTT